MAKVEVDYKHIQEYKSKGRVYRYLRVDGKRLGRLHYEPGTAQFHDEYMALLSGRLPEAKAAKVINAAPIREGTFRALWAKYQKSPEFLSYQLANRTVRHRILDWLCLQYGDKRLANLSAKDIRDLRDTLADKPHVSNQLLHAIRAMFKYGVADNQMPYNVARDVKLLPSPNPLGHHTWTDQEVARFQEQHHIGSNARLAFDLLLYTGQRVSDVVRLGPKHIGEDGLLHFVQHKNSSRRPVELALPIHPELQRTLDGSRLGTDTFLATAYDGTKPYLTESLATMFVIWTTQAGLPRGRVAHGLRKTAAVRLSDLGCSAHEIAAVTGHRTLTQVAHYTKATNQKKLAIAALAKLPERVEYEAKVSNSNVIRLSALSNRGKA